jgi:hypothetical protein
MATFGENEPQRTRPGERQLLAAGSSGERNARMEAGVAAEIV